MIISSPSDSPAVPVPAFDDDDGGFVGYDPLLFAQSESAMDLVADDDDSPFFTSPPVQYTPPPPPPIDVAGPIDDPVRSSAFSFEDEERSFGDGFVASSGTILPPPTEMSEGALVLREWMRQNAIRLELKDKTEKELLSQIIDEANEFKDEFYKKRLVSLETNKGIFREKEKLFLSSHEKFYAEADKHYWETIAELVLNEVPTIVKKNTNKDQQKKHSIDVIQGPKPGNPADLSRMQEILLKLKDNTPPHLDLSPPPTTTTAATKGGRNEAATPGASRVISPQPTALFGKMYAVN